MKASQEEVTKLITEQQVCKSIRVARHAADMTQDDAAKKVGVTRSTIGAWEGGDALSMSLGSASKMADAYGIGSIDKLISEYARA